MSEYIVSYIDTDGLNNMITVEVPISGDPNQELKDLVNTILHSCLDIKDVTDIFYAGDLDDEEEFDDEDDDEWDEPIGYGEEDY
jgi:hypothetical protein